jgi:hypothetical protein
MADTKISELPSSTGASLADNDKFVVVDTSANETKSINKDELVIGIVNTASVTSSGALMDSEITNLAQVKAFAGTDYATAAQGTLASNALPVAGGNLTGDLQVKGVRETVLAITGITPELDPTDGSIQTWTLSGDSTPTFAAGWEDGESLLIMVDDGTDYVISSFPTMKWSGGSPPTIATTGYSVITIWKVGGVFYGIFAGNMS